MKNHVTTTPAVDWLISHLRWPWLVIALLIGLGSELAVNFGEPGAAGSTPINQTGLYLFLGAGALYNLVFVAMLALNTFRDWTAIVAAIFDTLLAAGILVVSGSAAHLMLPIMLFPIITITMRLSVESGLLTALVLGLAYPVSILLAGEQPSVGLLVTIGADILVLFGAGVFAGFIFQKQLETRRAADQAELRRLRLANERAKAVYEMAGTLGATLHYRRVLNSMVDLAFMALSEAGRRDDTMVGMVLLVDEEKPQEVLRVQAGRNLPRTDETTRIVPKDGILRRAIYTAETVITNELQKDPVARHFVALQNCQSGLCTPLRAGFDIYGAVLFASTHPDAFTAEHADLLATFCNQAIIALQNAQLYEDLEREQQKLLEKDAQARHKLARDLHDGPTQDVSAIVMRLDYIRLMLQREKNIAKAVDEIKKVEDIAQRTTKNLRTMLFTLRPVVLETQGLAAALEQYADRLREVDNLNIQVDTSGYDGQLPSETEGVIFAVVEEAIGNAKKHAQANQINIRVKAVNGRVVTEIADNGKGFDVSAVKNSYDKRGSLGLLNMDERAKLVGGRCNIMSAPGRGTTVRLEVPTGPHREEPD